jgi:ABC-type bacteriocin/lantibiotic exporter with double-glycine peptidase domain
MKTPRLIAIVTVLLFLLVCCASSNRPSAVKVVIPDVPFYSQEAYQCGPTALAIVIDYWVKRSGQGLWLTPEQIAADIYSKSAHGVLGVDIENYSRRYGFVTRQYTGNMDDLRQNVDLRQPLILLVDNGNFAYQANHFMVVTGYTDKGFVVNSGKREGQWISEEELEKIWKRNRYWTLAIRP